MTWGLGQFLFGWLVWKGGVLPNWLAAVGMIGGAAGLLTLAVYQTPMLALLQLACFAIWEFATGILLFHRANMQEDYTATNLAP
jgi:predicted membrane chloride channel (bestrophin family)